MLHPLKKQSRIPPTEEKTLFMLAGCQPRPTEAIQPTTGCLKKKPQKNKREIWMGSWALCLYRPSSAHGRTREKSHFFGCFSNECRQPSITNHINIRHAFVQRLCHIICSSPRRINIAHCSGHRPAMPHSPRPVMPHSPSDFEACATGNSSNGYRLELGWAGLG